MELNPCLKCTRKNQNKNNPICRDCGKRIEYVIRLESELSYTASYDHDQLPAHRILFVSGGLDARSLCRDVIY